MRIDFCFQGWVRGADITEVVDKNGNKIDITTKGHDEVVKQLKEGNAFISLGDYLYDSKESEIEIFDYEESV